MGAVKSARRCGESKGLSPHLLREEDAISHTKSEHNVGWDREDSERKDQNKERTGEAGESREETDTHESAIPIRILVPFLPLIHSFVAGT
jgi:U3 small nucleolar RNA-associated protein 14